MKEKQSQKKKIYYVKYYSKHMLWEALGIESERNQIHSSSNRENIHYRGQ